MPVARLILCSTHDKDRCWFWVCVVLGSLSTSCQEVANLKTIAKPPTSHIYNGALLITYILCCLHLKKTKEKYHNGQPATKPVLTTEAKSHNPMKWHEPNRPKQHCTQHAASWLTDQLWCSADWRKACLWVFFKYLLLKNHVKSGESSQLWLCRCHFTLCTMEPETLLSFVHS